MNEYERLCALLKIWAENLSVLHHNPVGSNWFSDHERLGDYYSKIAGIADAVIERGLALGYREPTISEAVLAFSGDVLSAENRNARESFAAVRACFRAIAGTMASVEPETPPDVQNKLQEWQYWLNLEADYKLARLLDEMPGGRKMGFIRPEPVDDDDD